MTRDSCYLYGASFLRSQNKLNKLRVQRIYGAQVVRLGIDVTSSTTTTTRCLCSVSPRAGRADTPGVSLGCRLDSPWRVLGELFANYSEWPRLGPASTLDWTRHGEVFKSTHMIVSSTLTVFRHHHLQLILQIAKK